MGSPGKVLCGRVVIKTGSVSPPGGTEGTSVEGRGPEGILIFGRGGPGLGSFERRKPRFMADEVKMQLSTLLCCFWVVHRNNGVQTAPRGSMGSRFPKMDEASILPLDMTFREFDTIIRKDADPVRGVYRRDTQANCNVDDYGDAGL